MPAAIARGHERFLRIALTMPGTETSTSYGTPAVKVRGKLLSRWRTEAEGALAIRCDFLDRQILLLAQPEVFFLTDHYRDYPMILMRLEKASRATLARGGGARLAARCACEAGQTAGRVDGAMTPNASHTSA